MSTIPRKRSADDSPSGDVKRQCTSWPSVVRNTSHYDQTRAGFRSQMRVVAAVAVECRLASAAVTSASMAMYLAGLLAGDAALLERMREHERAIASAIAYMEYHPAQEPSSTSSSITTADSASASAIVAASASTEAVAAVAATTTTIIADLDKSTQDTGSQVPSVAAATTDDLEKSTQDTGSQEPTAAALASDIVFSPPPPSGFLAFVSQKRAPVTGTKRRLETASKTLPEGKRRCCIPPSLSTVGDHSVSTGGDLETVEMAGVAPTHAVAAVHSVSGQQPAIEVDSVSGEASVGGGFIDTAGQGHSGSPGGAYEDEMDGVAATHASSVAAHSVNGQQLHPIQPVHEVDSMSVDDGAVAEDWVLQDLDVVAEAPVVVDLDDQMEDAGDERVPSPSVQFQPSWAPGPVVVSGEATMDHDAPLAEEYNPVLFASDNLDPVLAPASPFSSSFFAISPAVLPSIETAAEDDQEEVDSAMPIDGMVAEEEEEAADDDDLDESLSFEVSRLSLRDAPTKEEQQPSQQQDQEEEPLPFFIDLTGDPSLSAALQQPSQQQSSPPGAESFEYEEDWEDDDEELPWDVQEAEQQQAGFAASALAPDIQSGEPDIYFGDEQEEEEEEEDEAEEDEDDEDDNSSVLSDPPSGEEDDLAPPPRAQPYDLGDAEHLFDEAAYERHLEEEEEEEQWGEEDEEQWGEEDEEDEDEDEDSGEDDEVFEADVATMTQMLSSSQLADEQLQQDMLQYQQQIQQYHESEQYQQPAGTAGSQQQSQSQSQSQQQQQQEQQQQQSQNQNQQQHQHQHQQEQEQQHQQQPQPQPQKRQLEEEEDGDGTIADRVRQRRREQ
ncbi:hypothetical protein GGR56DRAFT_670062 [Xylariaceae sp. FL0804]|nr:hypothetical protein GGR56DRAFT_670062 [Xylariaceae sp. FL0804]